MLMSFSTVAAGLLESHVLTRVQKDGVSIEDVMAYFYYGGMVYIGQKNYTRAIHYFSTVTITTNTSIDELTQIW